MDIPKGGNLAVYAASQIQPELQEKISAVCHDAPGFAGYHRAEAHWLSDVVENSPLCPTGDHRGMMLKSPDTPYCCAVWP